MNISAVESELLHSVCVCVCVCAYVCAAIKIN